MANMNYLAHLFLAEDSPESRIGNLLGDFLKGSLESYKTIYSEEIIQGVKTHRLVDVFTDTHPIFIKSKRRIAQKNRRFAGIIIDVFYDYFLANNWAKFSQENLDIFIKNIYITLEENQDILPAKLQKILPKILAENWLASYQSVSGVSLTLARIGRRLKRDNNLATAGDELINNYSEIESDFFNFFPELIAYVDKKCA